MSLDPTHEARIRDIFDKQGYMRTLGVTVDSVEAGQVVASMVPSNALTQQHGFVHAGAVAGLLDTVCGSAAYSLMPADAGVLTVEYKINLLSPADGDPRLGGA